MSEGRRSLLERLWDDVVETADTYVVEPVSGFIDDMREVSEALPIRVSRRGIRIEPATEPVRRATVGPDGVPNMIRRADEDPVEVELERPIFDEDGFRAVGPEGFRTARAIVRPRRTVQIPEDNALAALHEAFADTALLGYLDEVENAVAGGDDIDYYRDRQARLREESPIASSTGDALGVLSDALPVGKGLNAISRGIRRTLPRRVVPARAPQGVLDRVLSEAGPKPVTETVNAAVRRAGEEAAEQATRFNSFYDRLATGVAGAGVGAGMSAASTLANEDGTETVGPAQLAGSAAAGGVVGAAAPAIGPALRRVGGHLSTLSDEVAGRAGRLAPGIEYLDILAKAVSDPSSIGGLVDDGLERAAIAVPLRLGAGAASRAAAPAVRAAGRQLQRLPSVDGDTVAALPTVAATRVLNGGSRREPTSADAGVRRRPESLDFPTLPEAPRPHEAPTSPPAENEDSRPRRPSPDLDFPPLEPRDLERLRERFPSIMGGRIPGFPDDPTTLPPFDPQTAFPGGDRVRGAMLPTPGPPSRGRRGRGDANDVDVRIIEAMAGSPAESPAVEPRELPQLLGDHYPAIRQAMESGSTTRVAGLLRVAAAQNPELQRRLDPERGPYTRR